MPGAKAVTIRDPPAFCPFDVLEYDAVSHNEGLDGKAYSDEADRHAFVVTFIGCERVSAFSRSIALLTLKPLEDPATICSGLPRIELEYEGTPKHVDLQTGDSVALDAKTFRASCMYTIKVLQFLECREICEEIKRLPYLILPATRSSSAIPIAIDWPEVWAGIKRPQLLPLYESGIMADVTTESLGPLEDRTILEGLSFAERPLCALRLRTDVKLEDSFGQSEDGTLLNVSQLSSAKFKKVDKSLIDAEQPLLEVLSVPKSTDYLPGSKLISPAERRAQHFIVIPQLCQLGPLSISMLRACRLLPSIIAQLSRVLLAREVNKRLIDNAITSESLLVRALTTSISRPQASYEQLEFFGDCILKFCASCFVYCRDGQLNEGKLTDARSRYIDNVHLTEIAHRVKIDDRWTVAEHVFAETPIGKHWDRPRKAPTIMLKDKTFADLVEALLGAAWMSEDDVDEAHDLHGVFRCLNSLGIFRCNEQITMDVLRSQVRALVLSTLATDRNAHARNWPHLAGLERMLGYTFNHPYLALQSMTHSSSVQGSVAFSYERLEFLGDAVLSFCHGHLLWNRFPDRTTADYHVLQEYAVSNDSLAALCVTKGLDRFLKHNIGTFDGDLRAYKAFLETGDRSGSHGSVPFWHGKRAPRVLSDIVESVMGAVLLDSNFHLQTVKEVFMRLFKDHLETYIKLELSAVNPSLLPRRKAHPSTAMAAALA